LGFWFLCGDFGFGFLGEGSMFVAAKTKIPAIEFRFLSIFEMFCERVAGIGELATIFRKIENMRKYKLLLVLFITNSYTYSQSENDIVKYKADGIYVVLQNDKGEQLTKIPFGKDVEIEYDTFFKKFEIAHQNRDGEFVVMVLFFLSEEEHNGVKFLQMKDNYGNKFYVLGNMDKIGILIIIFDKKDEDGNTRLLTIEGAKRQ
jgi:hypothetical protein